LPDIYFDIETESEADLSAMAAYQYAAHHSTVIERIAYSYDGVAGMWVPALHGPNIPAELIDAARECRLAWAFNAGFDLTVLLALAPEIGDLLRPKIACMAHRSRAGGVRLKAGSLDATLTVLGAPEFAAKDKASLAQTGYSWAAPTAKAALAAFHALTDDVKEAARARYAAADVAALLWLDANLPPLHQFELDGFRANFEINRAGLPVDLSLAAAVVELGRSVTEEAAARFRGATGVNATQRGAAQAWFAANGLRLQNMQKQTLDEVIAAGKHDQRLLGLLEDYRTVSAKAYQKFDTVAARTFQGRLHETLRHDATKTGRDAGQVWNGQNLKRPTRGTEEQAALADFVLRGASIDEVRVVFGDPATACSDLQRAVVKPPAGRFLADGDFSKAEPMSGAWLTGEMPIALPYQTVASLAIQQLQAKKSSQQFAAMQLNQDLARVLGISAAELYATKITPETLPKASAWYSVGKAADLGSGYGQQAKGLQSSLAGKGVEIDDETAKALSAAVQATKPLTFKFGRDVMNALYWAVGGKATELADCKLRFERYKIAEETGVAMVLPSGRAVRYKGMFATRTLGYGGNVNASLGYFPEARKSSSGESLQKGIHLGVALENTFSAVARDFLYDALIRAISEGIEVVGAVHDEIIAVVDGPEGAKRLERVMNEPPSWSRGFSLSAEVELWTRYTK